MYSVMKLTIFSFRPVAERARGHTLHDLQNRSSKGCWRAITMHLTQSCLMKRAWVRGGEVLQVNARAVPAYRVDDTNRTNQMITNRQWLRGSV